MLGKKRKNQWKNQNLLGNPLTFWLSVSLSGSIVNALGRPIGRFITSASQWPESPKRCQNAQGDDPVSLALTCLAFAGEYVIDAETNQERVFTNVDWYACSCKLLQDRHKRLHRSIRAESLQANHYMIWQSCVCVFVRVLECAGRFVWHEAGGGTSSITQWFNSQTIWNPLECVFLDVSLLLIILPFFSEQLLKLQHNSQYYILSLPCLAFSLYLCHLWNKCAWTGYGQTAFHLG